MPGLVPGIHGGWHSSKTRREWPDKCGHHDKFL
jgi:hypothetical protein